MYRGFGKRFFDIVFSVLIILVCAPLFLVIAVAIKLDSPGPVVFAQRRLGKDGREFQIYKFRTMVVNAESGGVYSDDSDPRVTRVGSILRKTSLDELLQAVNILKGDMSFIGPRPPLTYHPWKLDAYSQFQRRMFEVRPGITGWAQVHGRKAVEWNHRIELNVWYVDHLSLWLDLKIAFLTVIQVLQNKDNENIGATVLPQAQIKKTEK